MYTVRFSHRRRVDCDRNFECSGTLISVMSEELNHSAIYDFTS